LLRDKVIFLIKSLPKSQRRHFIPVPNYADQCLKAMSPEDGDLLAALSGQLRRLTGVEIATSDWQVEALPNYLQMNFKLVDDKGGLLEQSRDLQYLKQQWAQQAAASFQSIPDSEYEQQGLTSWSFGDLPAQISLQQNKLEITAYPALIDHVSHVDLTLLDTAKQAAKQTHLGLRRLFMLAMADNIKYLHKNLPNIQQMCLHYVSVPDNPFNDKKGKHNTQQTPCEQLKTDLIHLAFDRCFINEQPVITKQKAN
jgi:ATP-dependent helicase HrpA